jgi:hypothetical protein
METVTNLTSIQFMLKHKAKFRLKMGRTKYNELLKLLIQYERNNREILKHIPKVSSDSSI